MAVDSWSQALLPAHFEAISLCWDESLAKAPIAERVKLVSFLVQLHPHFPSWKGEFSSLQLYGLLIHSRSIIVGHIIEILLQDDYEQKNGENEDGPAAAHLVRLLIMFQLSIHRRLFQSMYGLSSSEVAEQSLNADPDMALS